MTRTATSTGFFQIIPGLAPNVIDYQYDIITGNITWMAYNPGMTDQFFHRYDYDADNRLRTLATSGDGQIWDRDAEYAYYQHGPLKRASLGEDHMQGLDYVYTLRGWLKAVNHASLEPKTDPGRNSLNGEHLAFGRDAFSATNWAISRVISTGRHRPTTATPMRISARIPL